MARTHAPSKQKLGAAPQHHDHGIQPHFDSSDLLSMDKMSLIVSFVTACDALASQIPVWADMIKKHAKSTSQSARNDAARDKLEAHGELNHVVKGLVIYGVAGCAECLWKVKVKTWSTTRIFRQPEPSESGRPPMICATSVAVSVSFGRNYPNDGQVITGFRKYRLCASCRWSALGGSRQRSSP